MRKTTQFNMIFAPEVQPQLLDFVRDAFIMELLPGITRYLIFAESKENEGSGPTASASSLVSSLRASAMSVPA